MNRADYRRRLARTAFFAYLQHGLRIFLRMVWLFMAGWLFGWGLNAHYGWLPDPRWWWVLAVIFAVAGLFTLGLPGSSLVYFAWRVDRRLKYHEQFSAALELDASHAGSPIAQALLDDLQAPLRQLSRRVFRRGWYLYKDAESLLIVAVLLILVNLGGVQFFSPLPFTPLVVLPPLGTEAGLIDVFPSKIPGISENGVAGLGGSQGPAGDGQGNAGLTQDEFGEVGDVLSELGEDLSNLSATNQVGEALQQGDYQGAAEALESLAGDVDDLTLETRNELAEHLQTAADQLAEPGQQDLADSLAAAADGLESDQPGQASAGLDELAGDLHELAQNSAAGEDEFTRLVGEDGVLDLPAPPGGSTYLGSDTEAAEDAEIVTGGAEYRFPLPEEDLDSEIYIPYDLDWNDRDVVEEYFSQR